MELLDRNSFLTRKKVLLVVLAGVAILVIALLCLKPPYFDKFNPDALTWGNLIKNFGDGPSLMSLVMKGFDEFWEFVSEHFPGWWALVYAVIAFAILQLIKKKVEEIKSRKPYFWSSNQHGFSDSGIFQPLNGLLGTLKDVLPFVKKMVDKDFKGLIEGGAQLFDGTQKHNYLFLIDEHAPNDHFGRFWESSTRQFEKNALKTDRFFYNGDARLFYSKDQTEGLGIEDLKGLYGDSILVVIGDGYQMLDVDGGDLCTWTSTFESWEVRYLMTPRNPHSWDRRENRLMGLFHVLPADPGQLELLGYTPNDKEKVEPKTGEDDFLVDYHSSTFNAENLWKYFDQPTVEWIQACALHHQLDYPLTIELGQQVFSRYQRTLTLHDLYRVCQIWWFRTGIIPPDIRARLSKKLDEEGDKNGIRRWLRFKFPMLRPPEGSYAGDQFTESETINEWFDPSFNLTWKYRKVIRKRLNRIYSSGLYPNIYLTLVDGPHNRISRIFPVKWRYWIFNYGYSGLGVTQFVRNVIYSFLAATIMGSIFVLILWLSQGEGEGDDPATASVVETVLRIPVPETDSITLHIPGKRGAPVRGMIPGVTIRSPFRLKYDGKDTRVFRSRPGQKDSLSFTAVGDQVSNDVMVELRDTLFFEIGGEVNITLWDEVPVYLLAPVKDSVQVEIEVPLRTTDTLTHYVQLFLPPRKFPPWGPFNPPHPITRPGLSKVDTVWADPEKEVIWKRDTIDKEIPVVLTVWDTLRGPVERITIEIQDTIVDTAVIIVPVPGVTRIKLKRDTIRVPDGNTRWKTKTDTIYVRDTVEVAVPGRDSIIRDTIVIMNSVPFIIPIPKPIDTPMRRQVIISGIFNQCDDTEIVNSHFFKGFRVRGQSPVLFPGLDGKFDFTYLGYQGDELHLDVEPPYYVVDGPTVLQINNTINVESRLTVVDSSYFRPFITVLGKVKVAGMVSINDSLQLGDLMTVDSLSRDLTIELINGPPPYGEIAHHEGFFLHLLYDLKFCESRIRINFRDERDTILNLRNYAIGGDNRIDLANIEM